MASISFKQRFQDKLSLVPKCGTLQIQEKHKISKSNLPQSKCFLPDQSTELSISYPNSPYLKSIHRSRSLSSVLPFNIVIAKPILIPKNLTIKKNLKIDRINHMKEKIGINREQNKANLFNVRNKPRVNVKPGDVKLNLDLSKRMKSEMEYPYSQYKSIRAIKLPCN